MRLLRLCAILSVYMFVRYLKASVAIASLTQLQSSMLISLMFDRSTNDKRYILENHEQKTRALSDFATSKENITDTCVG